MDIKKVFENNRNWAEARKRVNPSFFLNLSLNQQPKMLYIGCSDSRVTAEELMGANPGDVFVYRNIANLVPAGDLASMAIINYAVTVLRVEHIVVAVTTTVEALRLHCSLKIWVYSIPGYEISVIFIATIGMKLKQTTQLPIGKDVW